MRQITILAIIIATIILGYGKTKMESDIHIVYINSSRESQTSNGGNVKSQKAIVETKSKSLHKAIVLNWQEPIAEKIRNKFGEDADTAIATFRAESGLRPSAQGWNCSYGVCNKEDRQNAISTDCGIAQINFPGAICPSESFNEDWNIEKAYEWKYLPNKKAGGTGFGPWVAHSTGRYLVFLTQE